MRPSAIFWSLLFACLLLAPRSAPCQTNPVLCWGTSTFGELGDGTTNSHSTASPAFFLSGFKQISAGGNHTVALTSDGHVYAWGNNANGQLGVGDKTSRSTPTLVPGLSNVISIAAGYSHSLALTSVGQVFSWGSNGSGALGLGDATDRTTPAVTLLTRIKAIACGSSHSLALSEAGDLFTTGYNLYGQLGVGNNTNSLFWTAVTPMARRIKAIAAGQVHSVLLLTDGSVWCAGDNTFGELGDGSTTARNVFIPSQVLSARAIGSGPAAFHTLAVRLNGTVTAWGRNGSGQLGNGLTQLGSSPVGMLKVQNAKAVSAGGAHSLVLLANGTAMAVGANFGGRLGDGTTTDRLTAVPVVGSVLWSQVSAGSGHSVALRCLDAPRTWGRGTEGQLGSGLFATRNKPGAMSGLAGGVTNVSIGNGFTIALKADGSVWTTGDNRFGQLGNGTTTSSSKPSRILGLTNVIAIAAGGFHCLAITADGFLWGWGENGSGQLGLGDRYNRLEPEVIDWGFVGISAGRDHSMVLDVDGSLYACGTNEFGQVGGSYPQKNPLFVPVPWNYAYLPVAIASGSAFNMTLDGDGTLSAWGHNGGGQLGLGDFNARLSPVHELGTQAVRHSCGYTHAFHLNALGELYGAGTADFGELGTGNTNFHNTWTFIRNGLADVAAGGIHSGATDPGGNLYMWGYNEEGAVGDGSFTNRLSPTLITSLPYVTGLWTGSDASSSAALTSPPIMLSSVKVSPASVTGGTSSTGTVTLTAAAGAGGLAVALASNNGAAVVPASVTVLAGSKTAAFTITTRTVTMTNKATIRGTLVLTKTATLTVNP